LRKLILFLVFSLISTCLNAQDLNRFDSLFFNLKTYNFSKANENLKKLNVENKITKNELNLLYNLLYKRETGDSLLLKVRSVSSKENNFTKAINQLNLGYHQLFYNPNKTLAYSHFYDALKFAENSNYNPLKKRAFLAFFEYFFHEIARNNENYRLYINEYHQLELDTYDHLWIAIYKLIFYSAQVDGINNNYNRTVKTFDSLTLKIKPNSNILPQVYFEKALYFDFNDSLDLAFKFYKKALLFSENLPYYNRLRFSSIIKIANFYYKKDDSKQALNYLKKAECCLNKYDSLIAIFYINYYKSKFQYKNKEYKEAYNTLITSNEAGYLLDFRKNSFDISNLQIELETEKKEKQNLQLKTSIEKEKRKKRNVWIGALVFILFGGITAFLIQKSAKRKQLLAEQEKEIESQKLATVLKEQELTAIDAMIEGQEKERQRIANDLHDDLGGLMTTVKWHFNSFKEKQTPELFEKTNTLLEEAYQKIRTIAHAKNSGVIAKQGLLKAIRNMAKTISVPNKLTIDVIDFGLETRLENSLELSIFRIIQELLTNVIKHAHATEVIIHITNHEDALNIMVEDNGIGFNPSQITKTKKGMGIISIDKRVEHLNGSMKIESELNKGTTIIIDFPL